MALRAHTAAACALAHLPAATTLPVVHHWIATRRSCSSPMSRVIKVGSGPGTEGERRSGHPAASGIGGRWLPPRGRPRGRGVGERVSRCMYPWAAASGVASRISTACVR